MYRQLPLICVYAGVSALRPCRQPYRSTVSLLYCKPYSKCFQRRSERRRVSDEILTERRGRVLVITINRPEARNAVNLAVSQGLADAVDELDADNGRRRLTGQHRVRGVGRLGVVGRSRRQRSVCIDVGHRRAFRASGARAARRSADEIGPVVAFLVSQRNSCMTGANVNVDGGSDFT